MKTGDNLKWFENFQVPCIYKLRESESKNSTLYVINYVCRAFTAAMGNTMYYYYTSQRVSDENFYVISTAAKTLPRYSLPRMRVLIMRCIELPKKNRKRCAIYRHGVRAK